MTAEFVSVFAASFVTFFVLIDAVGVAPIFASLTQDGSPAYRRRMAVKSIFVAAIILYAFTFFGAFLLDAMHISLDAFRAAGGILLFLIALDMVFEKRTERREARAEDVMEDQSPGAEEDVAVFPLAIPMVAGPGSIATAMLYTSGASAPAYAAVLLAMGANLVLALVIFLAAGPLMKLMGASIAGAITRILGVILAALSVQLLLDGVRGAFGLTG